MKKILVMAIMVGFSAVTAHAAGDLGVKKEVDCAQVIQASTQGLKKQNEAPSSSEDGEKSETAVEAK